MRRSRGYPRAAALLASLLALLALRWPPPSLAILAPPSLSSSRGSHPSLRLHCSPSHAAGDLLMLSLLLCAPRRPSLRVQDVALTGPRWDRGPLGAENRFPR
ncbi:hypothetical protein PAHAL_3G081200 [Panicum hallii]|uniref:Uncharacterized protein n=1 Tax=Panicum hallii TaxID=206008 RepID=A0A2T8KHI6_9POAL|nr:hypothetical protein PAHAL_3G081200 [Panicum hallii]